MQDEEGTEPVRPLSPHYWTLKKILDDAGVELVPTDRDLAPAVHTDEAEAEGPSGALD